jgi:uncharacterized damage-inducible protein DinB
MATAQPEVWLRGPIAGIAPLLQPVAHSLLQCREEVQSSMIGLTSEQIWSRPAGAASIDYHIRHAIGSLDRLFTYARGEMLSPAQLAALAAERAPDSAVSSGEQLASAFSAAVDRALDQLRATDESTLLDARAVGRARLPSSVVGLLFHAAEHTQRHVGQAVTTAKVLG